jgi:hypothetical protein
MGNQQSGANVDLSFTKEAIAAMPNEPIPFIAMDEDGNFSVAEKAKAALRAVGSGKICVISITGPSRSGKSALANFLLERQKGFEVGSTVGACTRGIWMWGRPRRATLPSGEPAWVVLLDCEGTGNFDVDSEHDVKLFSLACLLSSTILYNVSKKLRCACAFSAHVLYAPIF